MTMEATSWAWLDRLLTGGRVASLSGICSSATIVAPYPIAAFFTCLVTLLFASSCETACSVLWFIHVIMSVNTHLRRRIFMAVLHNAAEQIPDRLAIRPPVRETVGPRPTRKLQHTQTFFHGNIRWWVCGD